jgi:hypothetical protein
VVTITIPELLVLLGLLDCGRVLYFLRPSCLRCAHEAQKQAKPDA